jgi:DNA topoisomerase-3
VTRDLVERIRNGDIPDTAFATVDVPCPKCGGLIQENYRKFQYQKCDFSLWKVVSGREWAPEEVAELIQQRQIGPLTGFRSRMGKPFTALLRLNDEFRAEFDFGPSREQDESGAAPDFSGQTPLGACPKCGARVYEHGAAYVCEKALGAAHTCDFRSGKVILQQAVERAQMEKLLASGKTDLLTRFISRKGRPFKAFLAKRPEGSIGFEFMARAPRKEKSAGAPPPGAASAEVSPLKRAKPAPKVAKRAARPPAAAKAVRKRAAQR